MKLDRREFIKQAAITSAFATAGALFPGISFGSWNRLPGNPGVLMWQKTPCRFCGTGCGLLVGVWPVAPSETPSWSPTRRG